MISGLKQKVKEKFLNNSALCYLPSTREVFEQLHPQKINFELRLIKSLALKPTGLSPKPSDPFMPPFEEGLFLSAITPTHSLVFNKFCVCDEHVVLITNEFERQDTPLTLNDWTAAISVI